MIIALLTSLAFAGDTDVRVGVGILDVLELYGGHAISPRWEVHGTVGTNLGLVTYVGLGVGASWRPLHLGGEGAHSLTLGLGPNLWVGPAPSVVPVIASGDLELRYAWHRPDAALGLVVASRVGLGLTADLGSPRFQVEPALPVQFVQAGVTF